MQEYTTVKDIFHVESILSLTQQLQLIYISMIFPWLFEKNADI